MKIITTLITTITFLTTSTFSRGRPNFKSKRYKSRDAQVQNQNDTTVPEHEEDISWDNFQTFHDNGLHQDKFYLLRKAAILYPDREKNITRSQFFIFAKDYLIEDLIGGDLKLSLQCIADLRKIFGHAMWDSFTNYNTTKMFSFQDFYRFTIGGVLGHLIHDRVLWDELPAEFQHSIEEMYKDKEKHEIYELFGRGKRRGHAKVIDLKKKELKRKFNERYKGMEWSLDGRRVVDDDYDDLEPKYERKLHQERIKRNELDENEMDMLLDEDL